MNTVIDAATVAAIEDLELAGEALATGYLFGRHAGLRYGPGFEFAQYRAFQPGDSSRSVDWRLYARTDRLSVREAELETDQRVWLVLDTSASMGISPAGGPLTKLDLACRLAAAVGYLAQRQGDQLALMTLDAGGCRVRLAPGAGRAHWYQSLALLDQIQPRGQLKSPLQPPAHFDDLTDGALILVLSDFYQQSTELTDLLTAMAAGHRDVRALCLETDAEKYLQFRGVVRLEDPETGARVLTDPQLTGDSYRANRESYLAGVAASVRAAGGAFHRFSVDAPLDAELRRFLVEPYPGKNAA
ncbi:MAG: DUF58 domain-containing protein [Pseudomonadota bacterium]